MIKRAGVAVMNARTKNVAVAKETLEIISQGHYAAPSGAILDLSTDIAAAIKGTVLYKDVPHVHGKSVVPSLEVTNETTTQAARRLLDAGHTNIVGLNFASARNAGGGFLSGAMAQEEDLCRSSSLHACLKRKPVFYNENILCDNTYYTHNVIYSPDVPFFRDDNQLLMEQPYKLSIVSAPAPNVRPMENVDEDRLKDVLETRAFKILSVAAHHKHRVLILGAWGCGAFGNDPDMIANVFMDALAWVPAFERVCFAVYDTRDGQPLFEAFKKVVAGG
jgi:uncharacterized protein (TIGR02452 family)